MANVEERNKAIIVRWYREVWNQGRQDTVFELCDPDVIGQLEGMPDITLQGFLEFQAHLRGAFSDFSIRLLDIVANGERVVVEWIFTGTHDGELLGVPPSGRWVEQQGMTKFWLRRGKIYTGRDSWNLAALLDSLARPPIEFLMDRAGLTRRQAEVALLLADRKSAKEIARELDIQWNTARRHCQSVLQRLGVDSRRDVAEAIGRVDVVVSGPHPPGGYATEDSSAGT